MKDPLAIPPHRTTSHGVVMSPRLSRLYTWLQANNVRLTDFSTDTCVERELPRLRPLADELESLIAAGGPVYLTELAADLRNVMRRLPSARVGSGR